VLELRLDDREQLLARLARCIDEFQDALAEVAVVIHPGEAEVAER